MLRINAKKSLLVERDGGEKWVELVTKPKFIGSRQMEAVGQKRENRDGDEEGKKK